MLTALAFFFGSVTSIISGYIGMRIAVQANSRTAIKAIAGYGPGFVTAYRAGAVMGFALVSLGLLFLYLTVVLFSSLDLFADATTDQDISKLLFEAIAGYGLGGSSIALFGRVGGGIYTKAADVGSDLVGKVEQSIPEDDPRNPATIADNVGDNVGDIAGMGSDLFGSLAESSCAAMVIAAQSSLYVSIPYILFPLLITSVGILVGVVTSFFALRPNVVRVASDVEKVLKSQLVTSTVLITPLILILSLNSLPAEFTVSGKTVKNWEVFFCVASGLWSGLLIGFVTEYYTSHNYRPVQDVARSCDTGAATNIIYGLALGYKSAIIPVIALVFTIYVSFSLAAGYGIAVAALGMLSTLTIGLTVDAYGPISDNAGGIAEMAGLGESVREVTDAFDAAGNTTAAIGKGFAIGSAALVSLALFGAFVETAGLLFGALLPYWFSAMTMKSVGKAALTMVHEVRRQFAENPGILLGEVRPDYSQCVRISTDASLKEMIPPGNLVLFTPIIVGVLFGTKALAGVLAGALVSGVQMAISSSNSGGAWDNAKKYIESQGMKGTATHHAAVIGDTVGDPLKDTSGPALNILIKLMAILSLVLGPAFPEVGWIVSLWQ